MELKTARRMNHLKASEIREILKLAEKPEVISFAGGLPANPNEALWTIIAYQFVPLMSIVALVTTVANRITGRIWVGAFIVSMLIAWIVVASQATHFAF